MNPLILAYIPVLHRGYLDFFQRHRERAQTLFLPSVDIIAEHAYLEQEIRALDPHFSFRIISCLNMFDHIAVVGEKELALLPNTQHVILPREQIMMRIASRYLAHCEIEYDSTFLRWDEGHVDTKKPVVYDRMSTDTFDREMMDIARAAADNSSDWWRHVGAVIVKDRKYPMLRAYNAHVPSEYEQYAFGDIRDFIKSGEKSDISSALHAEKNLITEAARCGISLTGTDLYVTTFPCSDCAKYIAYSGIERCFFGGGHASFNGEAILRSRRVELIFVE